MMHFHTEIPITRYSSSFSHCDALLLLGSCFASDVGDRLRENGHPALSNPLGTLFNPTSIRRTIERLETSEPFTEKDFEWCDKQEHFFTYEAGTCWSCVTLAEAVAQTNQAVYLAHAHLVKSKCIFLTLGSAWAYQLRATGRIVSNCHRQANSKIMSTLACEVSPKGDEYIE